jgi:CBS-domain-containing membrane protein
MNEHYRTLKFSPIDPTSTCAQTDRGYENLTLKHPALAVMTDCRLVPAASITPQASLSKALEKMKTVGVRMLLVLDDQGTLKGLITAHDILGEGVIEYVEKHRIKREELTVNEIMQPIVALHGLPLQEVLNSTIGDLIHTLKGKGLQHVLVSTIEFGEAKIRGIFSAAEIGRQLGLEMDPMAPARSFAELEKVLLHAKAAA